MAAVERIMLNDTALASLYFMVSRNLVNSTMTAWADNIVDHYRKRQI